MKRLRQTLLHFSCNSTSCRNVSLSYPNRNIDVLVYSPVIVLVSIDAFRPRPLIHLNFQGLADLLPRFGALSLCYRVISTVSEERRDSSLVVYINAIEHVVHFSLYSLPVFARCYSIHPSIHLSHYLCIAFCLIITTDIILVIVL